MKITVTVMAHPRRKKEAEGLLKQLQQYPFYDAYITWDEQNNEWHTGARALRSGVGKGDWHVVIQDDAILTPEFYTNLEGAIKAAPLKTLISLYTGKARPFPKRIKHAVDKAYHATWLQYWLLLWGVAIALPADHIEPMLEFIADREEDYDIRIGIFYQRNRIPIYYTMPSLVDHDDDMGSLLGHGTAPGARVAHRLATGVVTWNDKVIDI